MLKLDAKHEGIEWKSLIDGIKSVFLFWPKFSNTINGFLFTRFIEKLYCFIVTVLPTRKAYSGIVCLIDLKVLIGII